MATITINITAEGPKAAEDALASMKSLVEAAQVQTLPATTPEPVVRTADKVLAAKAEAEAAKADKVLGGLGEPEAEAEAPKPRRRRSRAAAKPEPEPAPEVEAEDDEDDDLLGGGGPTMEDAVALATKLIDDDRAADVKAALASVGVKKVGELKGAGIAAFIEELS